MNRSGRGRVVESQRLSAAPRSPFVLRPDGQRPGVSARLTRLLSLASARPRETLSGCEERTEAADQGAAATRRPHLSRLCSIPLRPVMEHSPPATLNQDRATPPSIDGSN